MKKLTTLATVAALLTTPMLAADKILLKTPVAFSTELPGLGAPIVSQKDYCLSCHSHVPVDINTIRCLFVVQNKLG